MTVLQVVKALHAEEFEKHYENAYGDPRDTMFPLKDLVKMPVRNVDVSFEFHSMKIVLDTYY